MIELTHHRRCTIKKPADCCGSWASAQAIVKKYGSAAKAAAKRNAAVFTKVMQQAQRKRKSLEMQDGGFVAKVEVGTDYAAYLEVGTAR